MNTLTKPAVIDSEVEMDHDEKLVGLVSVLLWHLEIRQIAALYKSDDEGQALRIIADETTFREPIHRAMLRRVADAWAKAHREGKTLVDALHGLDDEEAWWIRCQLPTNVSEISGAERAARLALADYWKETCHG